MAIEFENPEVAGTVLIREAIQSQNFVAGADGWQIKSNGDAEFNDVTVRGVFKGTNFILNQSGLFFYSGTPAAGNLVGSFVSAAGTDEFGNAYDAGVTTKDNAANTSVRMSTLGRLFIDDTADWDHAAAIAVLPSLADGSFSTIFESAWNDAAPGDAPVALIMDAGNQDNSNPATFQIDTPLSTCETNLVLGTVDLGRGVQSVVQITSDITGITTTEVVLMTIPSMVFRTGRAYRITLVGLHQSTTAGTYFLYRIRKGSATTSGTIYIDQMRVPCLPIANSNGVVNMSYVLENNTGSDITTALTWTGSCASGTGQFNTPTANRAFATVEDIGAVGAWPGMSIS